MLLLRLYLRATVAGSLVLAGDQQARAEAPEIMSEEFSDKQVDYSAKLDVYL